MIFKILILFILFSLVKAIVPRYRFDQLMRLGWKIFLPLSLLWVVLTAGFLIMFDCFLCSLEALSKAFATLFSFFTI